MKHYCVTYYDGKGERQMYVQAKSINAAKAAASDMLRKNKTIGAAVRKAERMTLTEYLNALESFKSRQVGMSKLVSKFEEKRVYSKIAKQLDKKKTKYVPLQSSEVARIIKERR